MTKNQIFPTPQAALAHHGVKSMKWGVRRTAAGRSWAARQGADIMTATMRRGTYRTTKP